MEPSLSSGASTTVAVEPPHPAEKATTRRMSQVVAKEDLPRIPILEKVPTMQDASALRDNVRKITGFRWVLVCISLYLGAAMYGLDTTIAADVQGAVIETFGEVSQLAWVGAGFSLGSIAVLLPIGATYTTFNMKWVFVAGIVLFQAGSALCGAAPTMNALIVGRVLAGAGGSGIYLGVLNILTALTTREERGAYIGATGLVWGVGAILGPVVGGGFSVSAATWRWGFYINLIIGALTAPIYLFYLPAIHPQTGRTIKDRLAHLDFLGFVLSGAFWVAFGTAFVSAGGIWAWREGRTIATIIVCFVLLLMYVAQQFFCVFTTLATRSFPGHLLGSRTQVLVCIATACSITSLFINTYYIPIYFQFVNADTALMAAVRLLPFLMFAITFNMLAGVTLPRVQFYMPIYVAAGLLITLGGSLLHVYLEPSTPTAHIYGFSIIVAVGTGLTFQIGYAVSTLKVPPEEAGNAITMQNVSQIGATTICLVVAGQVFQSVAVSNLTAVLVGTGFTEADIHQAVAGAQSRLFLTLDGELRAAAILAITEAIQRSYILVMVAGILMVIVAAMMRVERVMM